MLVSRRPGQDPAVAPKGATVDPARLGCQATGEQSSPATMATGPPFKRTPEGARHPASRQWVCLGTRPQRRHALRPTRAEPPEDEATWMPRLPQPSSHHGLPGLRRLARPVARTPRASRGLVVTFLGGDRVTVPHPSARRLPVADPLLRSPQALSSEILHQRPEGPWLRCLPHQP